MDEIDGAHFIEARVAARILDVEQLEVLPDPRGGAHARGRVAHAVACRQRQAPIVVQEVGALARVHILVRHGDAAPHQGGLGGGLAVLQIDPGIVGNVVGAGGAVNLQDVGGEVAVGDADADVVAAHGTRPVRHAVRVDLAAEDAHGGGVLLVRRHIRRAAARCGLGGGRRDEGEDGKQHGQGGRGGPANGFVSAQGAGACAGQGVRMVLLYIRDA